MPIMPPQPKGNKYTYASLVASRLKSWLNGDEKMFRNELAVQDFGRGVLMISEAIYLINPDLNPPKKKERLPFASLTQTREIAYENSCQWAARPLLDMVGKYPIQATGVEKEVPSVSLRTLYGLLSVVLLAKEGFPLLEELRPTVENAIKIFGEMALEVAEYR